MRWRPIPGKPGAVRRIPAPLARLLALVLLFQAVLAPALCLAHAQGPSITMELCSGESMRLDLGDQAPAAEHGGFCALCAGLPQGAEAATPILPTPAWLAIAPVWPPGRDPGMATQARAPPQQPRAPPIQA